jgi:hypothetical protein
LAKLGILHISTIQRALFDNCIRGKELFNPSLILLELTIQPKAPAVATVLSVALAEAPVPRLVGVKIMVGIDV